MGKRLLVVCPTLRLEPETWFSMFENREDVLDGVCDVFDLLVDYENPSDGQADEPRSFFKRSGARHNVYVSAQKFRDYFLSRDYDLMLYWESDIVPPPDAVRRLVRVIDRGADVAYAPYAFRTKPHACSVFGRLAEKAGGCRNIGRTIDEPDSRYDMTYYPCSGAGLGFVLMRRVVVEKVLFRCGEFIDKATGTWNVGKAFVDTYFTDDVWRNGFEQRADLTCICEHIDIDGTVYKPSYQGGSYEVQVSKELFRDQGVFRRGVGV